MNSNYQGSNNYHGVVIIIIRVIVINHGVVTKKKKDCHLESARLPRPRGLGDVRRLLFDGGDEARFLR